MTYDHFLTLVSEEFQKNPEMRYPQVWFNLLSTHRSEISHKIIATPLDPFHKAYVSDETHAYVEQNW